MSEVFAVKIDATEFKKAELRLGVQYKQAPIVISRALNRAAATAKTTAIKQVSGNYYIKQKLIREKDIVTVFKANRSKLSAQVRVADGTLPLNYYNYSPKTPTPGKLVTVAVRKGGMKALNHAFVANINGLKIFERVGKKRLPIKRLYGPAVAQIVKGDRTREQIEKEAADMYKKRLDHEIKRLLEAKS